VLHKHLSGWQNWICAGELTLHLAVIEHNIHGSGNIQTVVRRNVHEAVTESTEHLWHAAIFRTEDVHSIVWVLEVGKPWPITSTMTAVNKVFA
jgi:hypothetical protein